MDLRAIYLKILAIPAGLEPATRGVEIRYSIQLSYGTVRPSYHRDDKKFHSDFNFFEPFRQVTDQPEGPLCLGRSASDQVWKMPDGLMETSSEIRMFDTLVVRF